MFSFLLAAVGYVRATHHSACAAEGHGGIWTPVESSSHDQPRVSGSSDPQQNFLFFVAIIVLGRFMDTLDNTRPVYFTSCGKQNNNNKKVETKKEWQKMLALDAFRIRGSML